MPVISRLVVKGFVQGIGFRAYVKQCALRLRIRGTVKNLPDGSVEIYCNAPNEEIYNKFKDLLRSAPEAEIDDIEEYFEGSEGYGHGPVEWIGFNILRDELSTIEETLEYVVLGGIMIRKEIKELSEKQDKMLEKQDETLGAIKDMHNDLAEKLDSIDSKLDVRFNSIDDSISNLTDTVNSKFDWLAERYGEFGRTMEELREDIHEMKEAFVKLTEHFTNNNNKASNKQ